MRQRFDSSAGDTTRGILTSSIDKFITDLLLGSGVYIKEEGQWVDAFQLHVYGQIFSSSSLITCHEISKFSLLCPSFVSPQVPKQQSLQTIGKGFTRLCAKILSSINSQVFCNRNAKTSGAHLALFSGTMSKYVHCTQ